MSMFVDGRKRSLPALLGDKRNTAAPSQESRRARRRKRCRPEFETGDPVTPEDALLLRGPCKKSAVVSPIAPAGGCPWRWNVMILCARRADCGAEAQQRRTLSRAARASLAAACASLPLH